MERTRCTRDTTCCTNAAASGTTPVSPSLGTSAHVRVNSRGRSTGLPSLPSMLTGSRPSSPYTSWTMPPVELRTVWSYCAHARGSAATHGS